MSTHRNRLCQLTGSFLLIAGSTTASAGLLGGLLGTSNEESSSQTTLAEEHSEKGRFSEPFAEPTIIVDGGAVETDEKCITRADGMDECKPAAGTMALLKDGRLLYLNALEGTENVELSIVAEFGEVSVNDQTRVLSLDENDTPSWIKPSPLDAGANPDGNDSETLLNGTELDGLIDTADNTSKNDGALFCSDVIGLANGDVMAVGGTDYYSEPGIDGLPLGVAELEGIKNSRIFDEATNTWRQSGDMTYGRWYPSLVTLGNGDVFVASGVTKLLKPVYPDEPLNSGRNVVQTETYNPCAGSWAENPSTADRSLPLYPRMHLLPNGHVLYNAGGQAFNPFGQGYDQALWNIVASYNPATQRWNDIGYAGLPLRLDEVGLGQLSSTLNITNLSLDQVGSLLGDVLEAPSDLLESGAELGISEEDLRMAIAGGMRGSTSSTMLPLKPNANGEYTHVELLTAGGVPSYALLTNPGGYLPTDQSRIDRITTNGDEIGYESRLTGPLNQPRWYGTNVLMPDGSVMVFSGGNRDGVVAPGLEGPIRTAERFDPETGTWTEMATGHRARTYHNTAVLMEDGRVMVAGHSPINTAYLTFVDLRDFGLAPYDGRDPSFEIYTPPYAMRDDRPKIQSAPRNLTVGDRFNIKVDQADQIDKALLIRRTVMTHVIDGDQRAIEMIMESGNGNKLTLKMPDNHNVVPAGEYMLFVSKQTTGGRVPSESAPITVVNENLECMAPAQVAGDTTTADGFIESTLEIL
ncbi:Galactose oxidase, central domain [Marinobacter sp. es.048]|uniref:galactose oxidase-like domain-containing protein n=1 Tax=Marinobacter sp. es.048 TaxID=1761795 RepID=UPI000B58DF6F|nr:galactose oxidase-like domain-containing protein [Marinobacter sp. es.048]SNC77135.1 Galactose oxidase, central domain [Marinobacter sp. es.048]